jgi:hypothetical protein
VSQNQIKVLIYLIVKYLKKSTVKLGMLEKMNTGFTFGILMLFALGQFVFAIKYMKETKGKSLEEIEKLWK